MSTALAQAFQGKPTDGEGAVPGDGGSLNSVYSGWGQFGPPMPGFDEGYNTSQFPAGRIPSGAESQDFRISDSEAFTNLRGIAKTNFPFQPYPAQDHPNQEASALTDNFQMSDTAGISSLLPGKFNYENANASLSKQILQEFDAGTSTYNSLPWAEGPFGVDNFDTKVNGSRRFQSGSAMNNLQEQQGLASQSIAEQFRDAYTSQAKEDLPLHFSKQYPNFGNGSVDTYREYLKSGADEVSEEILRAYHAVLPEGQLAGVKQDLMPVFSGINQEAVEQRPILQSLGLQRNTLYLGGVTELPDELRIDPRQSLLANANIPTQTVQTAGELASALDTLGFYQNIDGLSATSPYGQPMEGSKMIEGEAVAVNPAFYSYQNYQSNEPLVFGGQGYAYTSTDDNIIGQ
jgi:hypothetical protein